MGNYGIAVKRCFKSRPFPIDSHRKNINFVVENYGISKNRYFKKISHFPQKIPFLQDSSSVLIHYEKSWKVIMLSEDKCIIKYRGCLYTMLLYTPHHALCIIKYRGCLYTMLLYTPHYGFVQPWIH